MIIWVFFGFLSGNVLGNIFFQNQNQDIIQLTFVYSSEKATWIGETLTAFEQYWEEKQSLDSSLKDISLDFQAYGSGASLIALLNGEIKPVIWSPASNIWIPLLNAKWQESTASTEKLVSNSTRLVYSPIVLATWEEINESGEIHGLNDLHDYIVAHPNELKLAHTDPRSSNSGFMATIMMVGAYLQLPPDEITLDEISNPDLIDWMKTIESSVVQYGESTGFLGRYMRDNGPETLSMAFLYENLIQDYSTAAEEKYGQKIVAIYPEEGSLYSDHPFCILDADWVSEDQRFVAEEYINFISQNEMIKGAIATGFRPIDDSILEIPEIEEVYLNSFNSNFGVTSNPNVIHELLAPTDGTIISRIPDLWLMTRASNVN